MFNFKKSKCRFWRKNKWITTNLLAIMFKLLKHSIANYNRSDLFQTWNFIKLNNQSIDCYDTEVLIITLINIYV